MWGMKVFPAIVPVAEKREFRDDNMPVKPLPAWKKGLGISLTLSVTAALSVLIYHFEEETLESLLYMRKEFLFVAGLMVLTLCLLEGLRIKVLVATLTQGKRISLFAGMEIFLMTFFFAAVTPFAAGEWPAHIYALKRHGLSIGEATAVTVMRAFVTRILFTAAAFLMFLYFLEQPIPNFINQVFIYAFLGSLASTLVLLLLIWKPHLLERLLQKVSFLEKSARGRKVFFYLREEMGEYRDATHSLSRWHIGSVALIVLLTLGFWFFFFSIAPVLLLGLNRVVPFTQALSWQLIVQMITFYVPLPGGSGVVELGVARLYSFFVPASVLGLFVLSWRFFTYYLLLFFGGLVALKRIKL